MLHVVRLEVAAATPFGKAVGRPIIFAACNAMLRVINYGLPARLCDDPTRSQSTMPSLNIGDSDHVSIDAVTLLLKSEDPMPTTERTYARVFGGDRFNCRHVALRRLTGRTSRQMKGAEKQCSGSFHTRTSSRPDNFCNWGGRICSGMATVLSLAACPVSVRAVAGPCEWVGTSLIVPHEVKNCIQVRTQE